MSVKPLSIELGISDNDVGLEIPLNGKLGIGIPAVEDLSFKHGILGLRNGLAVVNLHRIDEGRSVRNEANDVDRRWVILRSALRAVRQNEGASRHCHQSKDKK